jgi:hypothetical protein
MELRVDMAFKKKSAMTPQELAADEARRARAAQTRAAKKAAAEEERRAAAKPANLPPLDPLSQSDDILSDAEIAAIYAEAKRKVAAERKKRRATAIYETALAAERSAAGLVTPQEEQRAQLDALVDLVIDLPRFKNQRDLPFLRVDGQWFWHGRSYRVTRAVAASLHEMMGRAKLHMAQFNGESRAYFDARQGRSVYQGGYAAGGVLMGAGA